MKMVTPLILQLLGISLIALALGLQGSAAQAVSQSFGIAPASPPMEGSTSPVHNGDPLSPSYHSNASDSNPPLALPPPRPAPAPDFQDGIEPSSSSETPVDSPRDMAPTVAPANASPPPPAIASPLPPTMASPLPPTIAFPPPSIIASPPPAPNAPPPSFIVASPPQPPNAPPPQNTNPSRPPPTMASPSPSANASPPPSSSSSLPTPTNPSPLPPTNPSPPPPTNASPSLPPAITSPPVAAIDSPPLPANAPPARGTASPPSDIRGDAPTSSEPVSNVSPPSTSHKKATVSKSPVSVPVAPAPPPNPPESLPQNTPNAMGKAPNSEPAAVPAQAPSRNTPPNSPNVPNTAPPHANPVNSSNSMTPVPGPVSSAPVKSPSKGRPTHSWAPRSNTTNASSPHANPANSSSNLAPSPGTIIPVAPPPRQAGEETPPPMNHGVHSVPPRRPPSPSINRTRHRKPETAPPGNITKALPPMSHFPHEASPPLTAPVPKSKRQSHGATAPSLNSPRSPPINEYHPPARPPEYLFHGRYQGGKKSHGPAPSHPISHGPAPSHPISPISTKKQGPSIPSSRNASSPSISDSSAAPVPSPSSTTSSGWTEMPLSSPKVSPPASSPRSPKVSVPPPIRGLPPPPPNEDCTTTICTEPYTNTPPGSPCGCVWPMQVGLRLGVALYTFFPLVSEFAEEIASGVFMKVSQVRIMGANAASEQPDKTDVLINLVPLSEKFDNTTSFLTYQRFWRKVVPINASLFVDYEVLYVRYPGLPASPLFAPNANRPNSGINGSLIKPLGVDLSKKRHNNGLSGGIIAAIALSATVAALLCFVFVWVLFSKGRNPALQPRAPPNMSVPAATSKPSGSAGSAVGSAPSFASLSFESSITPYAGSAKTFSASDIDKATNNFDASCVLGEGGFGRVYRGVLEDGSKVAVKVLKREDQQGSREFLAEVEMLSRLHHRNLVNLIGICTEERLRCLVYELVPNGSVESHLHGVDKESAPLNWEARLKVALGAARALAYLHEDSSPRVIHRDFKSSNILLENDFTPKVSDFGLARTGMEEENRHISTRVMGTFGYVAPEYAMTGHLLVKSDVYSYGVVLLELLTGRKPIDMLQPPGQENLVAWARPLLTNQEGLEVIMDQSLRTEVPYESVAKVAAIASMCVQPEVSHRPFMGEVVQALKLVCSECEDAKDALSRTSSSEVLSDNDAHGASSSRQLLDPLHGQYPPPKYDSELDAERGIAASEFLSVSSRFEGHRSGSESFRRFSSSGPIDGQSRKIWQKTRRLSGGTANELPGALRFHHGSH